MILYALYVALLLSHAAVSVAARPLEARGPLAHGRVPEPPEPNVLRRLAQWYLDDPHLFNQPGPNIHMQTHYEGFDKDMANDLMGLDNQAAVQQGDTTQLLDMAATVNVKRQNFDAVKDMMMTQVQTATQLAASNGDTAQANAVAQGTAGFWSNGILRRSDDIRPSMGLDNSQGAIMVALDSGAPAEDIPAAVITGREHAEAAAHPTATLNWRR